MARKKNEFLSREGFVVLFMIIGSNIAKFLNEYKIGITRDGKLYRVLETTKEYLTDNCTIYGRKYNLEDLPSINVTTGYNVTVKGGERLKGVELGEGTVDKTLL